MVQTQAQYAEYERSLCQAKEIVLQYKLKSGHQQHIISSQRFLIESFRKPENRVRNQPYLFPVEPIIQVLSTVERY